MRAVILGLGIGQVYKEQLLERNWEVVTVDPDPNKNATHSTIQEIPIQKYDLGIVALPNGLHYSMADQLAKFCKVVMIEKPGIKTVSEFEKLKKSNPNTMFFIAKNNLFRENLSHYYGIIDQFIARDGIESVEFRWENENRIPFPGSWFTCKKRAWGGVHRDLMPHLINELQLLLFILGLEGIPGRAEKSMARRYSLEQAQASGTEYGACYEGEDAIYDVDDRAKLWFNYRDVVFSCVADWKTDKPSFVGIETKFKDGSNLIFDLGLCPNYAYGIMIDNMMEAVEEPRIRDWHEKIDLELIKTLDSFAEIK